MAVDPRILRRRVEQTPDLPTLSPVVMRIGQMVRDPRTSASQVAKVVEEDQVLTARTLKLVNSAFYGYPGQIRTITRAIVVLGFNAVRNLVLSSSVLEKLNLPTDRFDFSALWKHAVTTAIASEAIVKSLRLTKLQDDAFVAGLLHDIGKVVMGICLREEFLQVLDRVERYDCPMVEAEQVVMELDHGRIGYWLLETWRFPESLQEAVRYHHDPGKAPNHAALASVIHVADIVARMLQVGSGGDRRLLRPDDFAWQVLELDEDRLDLVFEETVSGIELAKAFFEMIGDGRSG